MSKKKYMSIRDTNQQMQQTHKCPKTSSKRKNIFLFKLSEKKISLYSKHIIQIFQKYILE